LKEIDRWIRHYDAIRTNPDALPNHKEGWTSTKYPEIENMHWSEIAAIYVPELQMRWGSACSALKKSWFHLKLLKRRGEYAGDIQWRIQKIQRSLGIPVTQFEELEGLNLAESEFESEDGLNDQSSSDGEQWSKEEVQLRREEAEAAEDDEW
jgi:hypothetical protein